MVVNTLREWKLAARTGSSGSVFPSIVGTVLQHANMLMRCWYPLQRQAGMVDDKGRVKYGFHTLRHFCASWLIEQGFSAKRLQALLGHSSVVMTFDRYGHLFPSTEDDHARFAAGELDVLS